MADEKPNVPKWQATAILLAIVALASSAGLARWSWLLLDEQLSIRRDFEDLKNRQRQTDLQYEFWLKQVQDMGRSAKKQL